MPRAANRRPSALTLETLEARDVPSTVAAIREATGPDAAAITAARDAFRADLGGGTTAGANGSFGGVRREINWDGTPAIQSSPNALNPDFFNTTSPRGAVFGTPGASLQVSGNAADVGAGNVEFGNINATYPTAFATFSPQKLFTAVGSNVVDVQFFLPGTTTPAVVRGFGAVFTDVDTAGSTRIEFFDESGVRVFSRDVLATPGDGSLSFLGVTFAGNTIARVRITAGAAALGAPDVTQGGAADLVVMDDFIYSEPVLSAPDRLAVGGPANGTAQTYVADPATGQFTTPAAATLSPFGGAAATVRTATGDLDGDGIPDTIMVTGPGVPVRVAAVSGADNTTVLLAPFDPFGGNFTGGGYIAAGDLNGDGNVEIVVTPDQGGGPNVVIFSRNPADGTRSQLASFFGIDDPAFRGGARPALGDFNADGVLDLVVAAGFLGGPRVALFNGTTVLGTPTRLVGDFYAFTGTDVNNLRNGVFVAAGDVNGDGFADLIAGGGPGGGPRVFAISGKTLTGTGTGTGAEAAQAAPLMNFFVAGNENDRGGVRLATVDADGDNKADVVAGSGEGNPSRVRIYLGKNITTSTEPTTFQDIDPFGQALPGGVFVGSDPFTRPLS